MRWLLVPLILLGNAGVAAASPGYVNPFPNPDYVVGRTDMGVDFCLSPGDPIDAVGDGVIIGIQRDWFRRQPYIWYELTDGPDAGRYVYVAEQIIDLAGVGQAVRAGQRIATYAKKGTCIEMGWAVGDGATLAQATTGYHEGEVTRAGVSFARFLIARGVQGNFELTSPRGHASRGRHRRHRKHKSYKPPSWTASGSTPTQPTDGGGSSSGWPSGSWSWS